MILVETHLMIFIETWYPAEKICEIFTRNCREDFIAILLLRLHHMKFKI